MTAYRKRPDSPTLKLTRSWVDSRDSVLPKFKAKTETKPVAWRKSMIFGAPKRIVLCLLIFGGPDRRSSWCTSDHGVACGTDRSGTHVDHRKGTRIARAPLPCRRRARSDEFRPARTYTCPLWVMSGHRVTSASCPLFPSKRTFISAVCTSALCHQRTLQVTSKLACLAAALFAPHPGDAFNRP